MHPIASTGGQKTKQLNGGEFNGHTTLLDLADVMANLSIASMKLWHAGYLQLCRPGTPHGECALGEHCQCRFYEDLLAGCVDKHLCPEEERARRLEIEIEHLKKKHDEDWEKYYPYHLDAKYDDEHGRPYDYGLYLGDEDDRDDW